MFNENYWEDVLEANEDLRRINSRLEANVTYLNKELEEKNSVVNAQQILLNDCYEVISNLEKQNTKLTLKIEEESYKKQLEFVNIDCVINDLKNDSKIKFLLDKQELLDSIRGRINDLIQLLHEFEQIKEETE